MVDLAPDEQYAKSGPATTPVAGGEPDWALGFRVGAIVVTALGAAALVGAGVRLTGGGVAFLLAGPFLVWGLIPFGLGLLGVFRNGVGLPRSIAVILASGFGLTMYADLIWSSHLSSTAGLALVFIPLWQTLACAVGLLVTIPWRAKSEAA